MTTAWYRFEAADVLFFRDGRPFNQGDPAQMAVQTLFPPHPTTAVGALRAALARGMGWGGRGRWDPGIANTLGNGDNLNGLHFQGTYLTHGLAGPLFPAPGMIVKEKGDGREIRRLGPGPARECDLGGSVRLAEPKGIKRDARVKSLSGSWLTREGMQRVLNGGVPARAEIYLADEDYNDVGERLFAREVRIGLARNAKTRTAEQGALYSAGFVRPQAGENVGLVVGVDTQRELQPAASPIPLGGEGRFAWVEGGEEIVWPEPPATFQSAGGNLLYTVTLITPAHLPGDWPGPGQELAPELPGTIVCACHERPLMVGGWASRDVTADWGPQPLKAMLPAGSTWFLKAEGTADAETLRKLNGTHIGDRRDWGYGQILIGTWQDDHADAGGGER